MKTLSSWSVFGVVAGLVGAVWFAGCSSSNSTADGGTDGGGNTCGTGTLCGTTCADLPTDNANCGACGTVCATGQVCSKGACATSCGGGTTLCGTTCNDTNTDPNNCGGCTNKCVSGQVCSAGKCAATCASTEMLCGSSCVDTQTDNANCGGCGTICGPGQACKAGGCALTCQTGLTLCTGPTLPDGGVSDASTDGATTDASTDATTIDASTDAAISDAATDAADAGPILAYPYCADFQSDDANCGGCGIVCASGQTCNSGTCKWQVNTITVTQSMMVGTAYTSCGNTPPEFSGAPCGTGVPGFTWTDTVNQAPSTISIKVDAAWNCNGSPTTPRNVLLNGTVVGTIVPGGTCVCSPGTFVRAVAFTSVTPFVQGGVNTVTFPFISTGNCEAYEPNPAWGNDYGFITVTY